MARLIFYPVPAPTGVTVRFDTASGTNTPADITPLDRGTSIIGSKLVAGHRTGVLPTIYGPDGVTTLYQKQLDYSGAVTATLATLTGSAISTPVATGGGGGAALTETVATVATSGAAQTIPDVSVATINDITLTAACTLTFPAAGAGKSFMLRLKQDATGGRLVTWPGTVKWAGGVAPILSTGAGKTDIVSMTCVDGTNWFGFLAALDVR